MTYRRLVLPLSVLIAALLSVTIATAQTGSGYDLTWTTSNSGGGTTSSGGYTLNLTLGQVDAGVQSGGGYTLMGGFWSGVSEASSGPVDHWLYLPLVRR